MLRRGFTIVEIIITITIMGILLVLAVVSLNSSQLASRDTERKADIEAIQTNLETIYTSGISDINQIPNLTNLAPNPSAETNRNGWEGWTPDATSTNGSVTDPACVIGKSCFWMVWSSAGANAGGGFFYGSQTVDVLPVQAGKQYTASGYIRTNATSMRASIDWYNSAGTRISVTNGTYTTLLPGIWTRLWVTAVAPAGTVRMIVNFYPASSWTTGSWLNADGIMVTEGSTLYDYNDGSSSKWSWKGTAHASTSSGPLVVPGSIGGYPSASMLASDTTLTAYFGDTDSKALLPPGATSVTSSFILATNNSQSATDVTPQPTISQYVYQPLDSSGRLCLNTPDCRKYNLYYRLEKDNTVYMVTSKNQ